MFVGSKTFLNRVAIIAGSFLYLKIGSLFLFSKFTTKPESTSHAFGLNLILYNIILPASKPQRGIQAKVQVDSDAHCGGEEIFDSQKFLVWVSQRKCYNLADATEVCPPSRPH
jgi:hypothetical protein